jgi:two-component system chemotaxis sensor kinase CheA
MDDLLRDFLTESNENLTRLDGEIVLLEKKPGDRELLASIFRTIHTIKGTCGFLGLGRLEAVAHVAESVLGRLRDGELGVTPEVISDVLSAVDAIKSILAGLEQAGAEPPGDDAAVIARLEAWQTGAPASAARPFPSTGPAAAPSRPKAPAPAVAQPTAPAEGGTAADAEVKDGKSAIADSSLRVHVTILDSLMNLVGELVLARNQLLQLSRTQEDSVYLAPVQHLNRVTTDLQEAVMKTRMQPVGNAWTKLPRLVRDLCQANGKQIELEQHGADTELDRQILQAIQDPLVHMVRNSADHGIEAPAARRKAGKPERGTIRLNAYHEGGHVILEVSDDGAGIDPAVVRSKAVERGLATQAAVKQMSDSQVLQFVFLPGFSTATKVTNVSGRGVGMDVVRSNVERIGGTVDLSSTPGAGTMIRIKIPLTLAIISALVVGAGGEAFAIPQIGVVELVRVTAESRGLVEDVHGARFYRLRDKLLPLVDLGATLGLPVEADREEETIVVCQVGEARYGLVVTEVFDTQEIVVKPVGRLVKHLTAYAGCTILGDGRVIMILDTAGLASRGRIGEQAEAAEAAARADQGVARASDAQSLLLFDVGERALRAVPLSLVARLEEFPGASIESADGRSLVQYRGALLPVVPAREGMDVRARDPRPVIVFSDGARSMGLAVEEIRDIVEDRVVVETRAARPGVLGAAVINGKATEVLDTQHYLQQAHADWFDATAGAESGARPVLLVSRSPFFESLMVPALEAEGFRVTSCHDAGEALAHVGAGEAFHAVLCDVGNKAVGAFDLARQIRANPAWNGITLLALTGKVSAAQQRRAQAAGFTHYLPKADRGAIVARLAEAGDVLEEAAA